MYMKILILTITLGLIPACNLLKPGIQKSYWLDESSNLRCNQYCVQYKASAGYRVSHEKGLPCKICGG